MPLEDILTGLGLDRPAPVAVPPGRLAYAPGETPANEFDSQAWSLASGTPLDVPLGFRVGSVIVDNNTSSSLNVPDATADGVGRWVPPGAPAAFPILGDVSRARINWTAAPGRAQSPFKAGEAAQVIFFAAPLPPGQGVAAPNNQSLPWLTPNKTPLSNIAAAASELIAGVPGQIIYLFGMLISPTAVSAGNSINLTDGNGGPIIAAFGTAALGGQSFDAHGAPLTPGNGLWITLPAGVNALWSIAYSQA